MSKDGGRGCPPYQFPTPAHGLADKLAAELLGVRAALTEIQEEAALDLAIIKELYAGRVQAMKAAAASLKKKIEALEKKYQTDFFAGPSSQVTLPHVVLTYDVEGHVKQVEGVLAALEDLAVLELCGVPGYEGFVEAIRVEKSVRYEVLEKWSEARLLLAGTERVKKDVFSFELREPQGPQAGTP